MIQILGIDILKWMEVVMAIIGTIVVAYIVSWVFGRVLRKTALPDDNKKKLTVAMRYIVYAIGSILIIVFLAFDIIWTIISLGVLGLGISFALGGFVSSLISDMMVILDKDFKVGDEIKVAAFQGKVVKITLRKTILDTGTGEKVSVPNAFLLSNPVAIRRTEERQKKKS
jgi:small-conductance mechanosensitive channel